MRGMVAIVAAVLVLVGCGSSGSSGSSGSASVDDKPAVGDPLPLTATGSFTSGDVGCDDLTMVPAPGTATASTTTQVSLRGADPSTLTNATVTVTGSASGGHDGQVTADSDGNGVSFRSDAPFTPGETVTVTAPGEICGADADTATFTIGATDMADLPTDPDPATELPETTDDDVEHFVTEPDLAVPVLEVEHANSQDMGDDVYLLGAKGATLPGGAMLVDGAGEVLWYDTAPEDTQVADVRVQEFDGEPVLTWWQGESNLGNGTGVGVVVDDTYTQVATVEAANGYDADLHEFLLAPDGTAWFTIYAEAPADLSDQGGPSNARVYDGIVQQVDVATGNVLFEWHSLDHVGLSASAVDYDPEAARPYDYFHVNSVQPSGKGTVLVSARNTNAVYLLDEATGALLWTLGGVGIGLRHGRGHRVRLPARRPFPR